MATRGLSRILAALQASLLVASLVLPALAAAATIQTDLWIYQDGDTVTVTGVEFGANETVDFVTTDPVGTVVDTGSADTDEFGNVTYAFVLHATMPGIYDVIATGRLSGLNAATQFDPLTSVSSPVTSEGASGEHTLTFVVGISGVAASYYWRTQPGTATGGPACGPGIDYVTIPSSTVLTNSGFAVGVTICGDGTPEVDETLALQVANNSGFTNGGGKQHHRGYGDDQER